MNNITTVSNVVTTAAQVVQNNKTDAEQNEQTLKFLNLLKETNNFVVNPSNFGNNQSDIADAYKRAVGEYNDLRDGSESEEDEEEGIVTTFFDEMSGEIFEIRLLPPDNRLKLSKEEMERFSRIYPRGSKIHKFKLAEMAGRGKIIDGVPVRYIDKLAQGFDVHVYGKNFSLSKEYHVAIDSGKVNPTMFFDKVHEFKEINEIKDLRTNYFWESFLKKLKS